MTPMVQEERRDLTKITCIVESARKLVVTVKDMNVLEMVAVVLLVAM